MSELLDKLSSYNLFNYLLPGFVFAVICGALTKYTVLQQDIIVGAFLYYFIGLIISRIGSVIIEPILKKVGLIKYSLYEEYIHACNEDDLIPVLSEANNMYRTFCSLFMCLIFLKVFEVASESFAFIDSNSLEILILFLLGLFAISYKKQSEYIKKRIDKTNRTS